MAKRWQPPPMNEPEAESAGPKVTVDEKVVRKMLQVNPALRDGRTTFQVKKDMEGGQAVRTNTDRGNTGPVPSKSSSDAAVTAPKSSGPKGELEETVGFFLKGKVEGLDGRLGELAALRRDLEAQERAVRDAFKNDLAKFVAMLDPQVVALHGVSVLSRHKAVLDKVGLTPAVVLEAARKLRGAS